MKWFFGQYIDQLRVRKGWSKSQLAKETGLSTGYISWLIHGETSGKTNPPNLTIDTLLALSRALGISVEDLVIAYQGKDPLDEKTNGRSPMDLLEEALRLLNHEKL